MTQHLITGGAGCIGSELAGELLRRGDRVRVIDNLSTGRIEHIAQFMDLPEFEFIEGDICGPSKDWLFADIAFARVDTVWHLAAKTDIKFIGDYDFNADITQNFTATWELLQAMMEYHVKRLVFASSAAVYGDPTDKMHRPNSAFTPTTCDFCGKPRDEWKTAECLKYPPAILREDLPLNPVSMYGATKLACEKVITALALRGQLQAWIFRYCSIVSRKARKSGNMVIPDLIHKLQKDPTRLEILGDGNQTKPSMLVDDCVAAMLHVVEHVDEPVSVHNIGNWDAISVTRQAQLICEAMGLNPKIEYTGGAGGWPGDVPSFRMSTKKLERAGWISPHNSVDACRIAIAGLLESGE